MRPQVLIVDDDAGVLFLHNLMVRESGISENINTFNSADKGLSFLRSRIENGKKFLVFLDINMPVISGWDFLETLEHLDPDINVYVVMVTSSVNRSDREKASEYSHVIDFLEKPLTIDTCTEIMNHQKLKDLFDGRDE